jgi:flagellar biosynthetic protein FliP
LARTAIGTQQVPPNAVLISLALFMTVFIMTPVWQEVNSKALQPYNQGKISQAQAIEVGMKPLRKFMFKQTREKDLALFIQFSKIPAPKTINDVPTYVLIPAFMISELKTSFQIGFLLFIPFVIIDLVVANILLSLGMFMLSPVMVSLPFKILLFVLADGWNLITRGLMISF